MKKFLLFLCMSIFLSSCVTNSVKSTKGTRKVSKDIKGEWILSSITHNRQGKYDITLFRDTSKECFQGSVWKFVPNNFKGIYIIDKKGCATGDRHFIFVVQEIDANGYYDFLLKPTDENYKSDVNEGVRMRVSSITDNTMTWTQTLNVDGKPFIISMNFTKK